MGGAKAFGEPGELEALALKAGNDVVEFPKDFVVALEGIKKALQEGVLTWSEIDEKCRRVLAAKYWVGLADYSPLSGKI